MSHAASLSLLLLLSCRMQAEVESYYIGRQELLPGFHQHYWMGLQYDNSTGYWNWNDFSPLDQDRGCVPDERGGGGSAGWHAAQKQGCLLDRHNSTAPPGRRLHQLCYLL